MIGFLVCMILALISFIGLIIVDLYNFNKEVLGNLQIEEIVQRIGLDATKIRSTVGQRLHDAFEMIESKLSVTVPD